MTDLKPPERIYLQAGSQGSYKIGQDATWCDHRIDDEDVEYVLASEPESAEAIPHPVDWAQYHEALADGRIPEDPLPESASVGEVRVGVARTLHLVCNIGIGEAGGVGVGWDTLSERERELWLYDESTSAIIKLLATHTKPPKADFNACTSCGRPVDHAGRPQDPDDPNDPYFGGATLSAIQEAMSSEPEE